MQSKKAKADIDKIMKKRIIAILKKNDVAKAGIFGSYARGDATKNSDIDILIQPPKGIGLGFVGIKLELEEKLGRKVDLVTYNSIHPYLKKYILDGEIRIL
ncbi:nucleotidyltransferase family protein [Candidatus Woesearchaeota archaeon]|nr:nucleotidyltransferase family protein [Candidatus Woesearchaeota archaeon]